MAEGRPKEEKANSGGNPRRPMTAEEFESAPALTHCKTIIRRLLAVSNPNSTQWCGSQRTNPQEKQSRRSEQKAKKALQPRDMIQ
jgi:hypothetical protein